MKQDLLVLRQKVKRMENDLRSTVSPSVVEESECEEDVWENTSGNDNAGKKSDESEAAPAVCPEGERQDEAGREKSVCAWWPPE